MKKLVDSLISPKACEHKQNNFSLVVEMRINELSKKQRTELGAAVIFIKSLNTNINYEDLTFPSEADVVDVIYEPQKIKFQVTSVDGGPNKLLRHEKYSYADKLDEIVDKYIIGPTKKKSEKYRGRGVSDVILLIHSINKPGRADELESDIKNRWKEIAKISKESGFKSIYLIFDMPEEALLIYNILH